MNKTPEILFIAPGHRYTREAVSYFGEVACGKLDAFGFIYSPGEGEQFVPVFTASQGQSERSLTWLGTRVSKSFIQNAESQVREVRQEAGVDYQASLRFIGRISREEATRYAETIEQAFEQQIIVSRAAQPETGLVS
ncbi:MAG TPA: hypothetical protein VK712_02395 [Verrucomicrobiae bacterium]|nr:hypothetical protein [Verrucomicrobiae bacterium]